MTEKKPKVEAMIEDLAITIANSFEKSQEHMDKRFEQVDARFEQIDKRFERVEDNIFTIKEDIYGLKEDVSGLEQNVSKLQTGMDWTKNVLDLHTGLLQRLDQERAFTMSHVQRLEDEIDRIKKQLKIA